MLFCPSSYHFGHTVCQHLGDQDLQVESAIYCTQGECPSLEGGLGYLGPGIQLILKLKL